MMFARYESLYVLTHVTVTIQVLQCVVFFSTDKQILNVYSSAR